MVNQLLGASEVETFVRGDMDNEVCECAVSILETTDLHFGCTPTRLALEVSKRLACVSLRLWENAGAARSKRNAVNARGIVSAMLVNRLFLCPSRSGWWFVMPGKQCVRRYI